MLENKNIIITGAGSGIGRATSILAAGYGASVVCVDLNPCVEETVQEIKAGNGNAVAQIADVSREDDVQHYIQICIDTFGSLHGIYANAGVSAWRQTDARPHRRRLAPHSERQHAWAYFSPLNIACPILPKQALARLYAQPPWPGCAQTQAVLTIVPARPVSSALLKPWPINYTAPVYVSTRSVRGLLKQA